MSEVQYIFYEAIAKGWLKDEVVVVRKGGRVFDYVLPGEQIRQHEMVSIEKLDTVMQELSTYY